MKRTLVLATFHFFPCFGTDTNGLQRSSTLLSGAVSCSDQVHPAAAQLFAIRPSPLLLGEDCVWLGSKERHKTLPLGHRPAQNTTP